MKKDKIKVMEKTAMGRYLEMLIPHGKDVNFISTLDTVLRECIGKTDRMEWGKCSHNAILERERNAKGKNPEHYCRCCGIYLNVNGIGRCNDWLVIRNKKCRGPICLDCIKNRPDIFYEAYKRGLKKMQRLKGNYLGI